MTYEAMCFGLETVQVPPPSFETWLSRDRSPGLSRHHVHDLSLDDISHFYPLCIADASSSKTMALHVLHMGYSGLDKDRTRWLLAHAFSLQKLLIGSYGLPQTAIRTFTCLSP